MRLDTEATLQAEFYHACRLLEIPCILELETPAGRLDAAILNSAHTALLCIVEVKRNEYSLRNGNSPQLVRYRKLGAPVLTLTHKDNPHTLAQFIKDAAYTGTPLSHIQTLTHIKEHRRQERKASRAKRLYERWNENLNFRH